MELLTYLMFHTVRFKVVGVELMSSRNANSILHIASVEINNRIDFRKLNDYC
jgi:hypothetical protein